MVFVLMAMGLVYNQFVIDVTIFSAGCVAGVL